eukprot:Lithocolla_globosa_v1_NODE_70_length_7053_cov_4.426408.p8 type:complete len:108 gc:universal NODE_70_length_7053_cov_4.426408:6215-5892(-)
MKISDSPSLPVCPTNSSCVRRTVGTTTTETNVHVSDTESVTDQTKVWFVGAVIFNIKLASPRMKYQKSIETENANRGRTTTGGVIKLAVWFGKLVELRKAKIPIPEE